MEVKSGGSGRGKLAASHPGSTSRPEARRAMTVLGVRFQAPLTVITEATVAAEGTFCAPTARCNVAQVLEAPNKPQELRVSRDAACRRWANSEVGRERKREREREKAREQERERESQKVPNEQGDNQLMATQKGVSERWPRPRSWSRRRRCKKPEPS